MTRCDRRTNARWLRHVRVVVRRGRLLGSRGRAIVNADNGFDADGDGEPDSRAHIDTSLVDKPQCYFDRRRRHRSGTYPSFTVQAPSVWSSTDGHFVNEPDGSVVLGLSVWDVGRGPSEPVPLAGAHLRSRADGRRSRRGTRGPVHAQRHDADRCDARRIPRPLPRVVGTG